jgi:hypothetical protein
MADEQDNTQETQGSEGADQNREQQGGEQGQDKSLLSRAAQNKEQDGGKGKEDKPGEGEGQKTREDKDDPAARAPDKPEGYELKFAPETGVDTELLDGFRKTAHELGLTQKQAQALGALYEGHMSKAAERMQAEQTKYLLEARKGWETELAKSPAFEADLGLIQKALRQFGDQELYELLDQTNLGSHPKMFAFMAKIGKALAEPGLRGERDKEAKSAAKVLYPNMN